VKKSLSVLSVLCAALSLLTPSIASASTGRFWQCVTYAREISGIQIHGNAKTWWGQAAGKYDRGSTPREGAVMALPGYGKMRLGHVATVSKVIDNRNILLTHANWSRRGKIEYNVRAVDVSDSGDWSRVKIWYAGNGDLGTTSYPVYGFIYGSPVKREFRLDQPKQDRGPLLSDDVIRLASLEMSGAARSN
jgi:surface antigen